MYGNPPSLWGKIAHFCWCGHVKSSAELEITASLRNLDVTDRGTLKEIHMTK